MNFRVWSSVEERVTRGLLIRYKDIRTNTYAHSHTRNARKQNENRKAKIAMKINFSPGFLLDRVGRPPGLVARPKFPYSDMLNVPPPPVRLSVLTFCIKRFLF